MKCEKCGKIFDNPTKFFNHRKQQCRNKICGNCGANFQTRSNLLRHQKQQNNISCHHCDEKFCNNNHYQQHLRSIRKPPDETIPDLDQQIYPPSGYEEEDGYLDMLHQKRNEIQDRTKKASRYEIINKEIDSSYTYRDIDKSLVDILVTRKRPFKVNISMGFILYNTTAKEYMLQITICSLILQSR